LNIRESVGRALISDHLESKHYESFIDRVGAHAWGSDLGRALWFWAVAGDERSAGSVFKHLLRKARNRLGISKGHRENKILELICVLVMYEWRYPGCLNCGGIGYVDGNFGASGSMARIICHSCSGSGKHRYEDVMRMEFLKVDMERYKKFEGHISKVSAVLSVFDLDTVAICRKQLELDTV
jgi:hypothetical protein